MAKEEKPKGGTTASGDRQAESREAHSDMVFPKQRGPGQFGTHGGPDKRQPPPPSEGNTEQGNRK